MFVLKKAVWVTIYIYYVVSIPLLYSLIPLILHICHNREITELIQKSPPHILYRINKNAQDLLVGISRVSGLEYVVVILLLVILAHAGARLSVCVCLSVCSLNSYPLSPSP